MRNSTSSTKAMADQKMSRRLVSRLMHSNRLRYLQCPSSHRVGLWSQYRNLRRPRDDHQMPDLRQLEPVLMPSFTTRRCQKSLEGSLRQSRRCRRCLKWPPSPSLRPNTPDPHHIMYRLRKLLRQSRAGHPTRPHRRYLTSHLTRLTTSPLMAERSLVRVRSFNRLLLGIRHLHHNEPFR